MVCLSRPYPFKFFKGCLRQNLLSPLLNTLSHIGVKDSKYLSLAFPSNGTEFSDLLVLVSSNHVLLFAFFFCYTESFIISQDSPIVPKKLSLEEETKTNETLKKLLEMKIKFPGKTDEEAEALLQKVLVYVVFFVYEYYSLCKYQFDPQQSNKGHFLSTVTAPLTQC